MEPEAPMATRTLIKHNGDIGEAEVLKNFLLMGATVNSLTGSDYGLDLHVQLPLRPQKYGQLEKSWFLSGRVAHAQVKNMTSGQDPSVSVGRIRGWIAGAEVGTPTFVVILKKDRTLFASPRDLKVILAAWEDSHAVELARDALRETGEEAESQAPKSVMLSEKKIQSFRPQTFPWLLHLWTSYPGVMMRSDVQKWPDADPTDLPKLGTQFITEVLLAWMKSHYADSTPVLSKAKISERAEDDGTCVFEGSESAVGALLIVQTGFRGMYPEESKQSTFSENLGWDVVNQLGLAWRKHQQYPHSNLMTSYATSPHTGRALEEAAQLLKDVMEFHFHCRVTWQGPETAPTAQTGNGTDMNPAQATPSD